jgi:uncharacterized membrane protein YhaH (DUF805 family)
MFGRINILPIFKDHLLTLTGADGGRVQKRDLFLFYGIPLLVAVVMARFECIPNKEASGQISTIAGILVGLLFNALLLVYAILERSRKIDDKGKEPSPNEQVRQDAFVKTLVHLYRNIAYAILISAFCGILAVPFWLECLTKGSWLQVLLAGVFYLCIGNFVMTTLMIMKRIHALISFDISK